MASGLIFWRAQAYSLAWLWQDWVVLLCVYWILAALLRSWRSWPFVTAVWMAALLAIYSVVQIPLTFAALRLDAP
ncbi:MAG: hypothetical protein JO332_09500 [Planctomycetaceae bacterium]|nr:hypothetical protein [Planctomycetaceae bacterium]